MSEKKLLLATLRLFPHYHYALLVLIDGRLLPIAICMSEVLGTSYISVALCLPCFDDISGNFAYGLSILSASDLERYSQGLRVPL